MMPPDQRELTQRCARGLTKVLLSPKCQLLLICNWLKEQPGANPPPPAPSSRPSSRISQLLINILTGYRLEDLLTLFFLKSLKQPYEFNSFIVFKGILSKES